jgi:hypothetical protein
MVGVYCCCSLGPYPAGCIRALQTLFMFIVVLWMVVLGRWTACLFAFTSPQM